MRKFATLSIVILLLFVLSAGIMDGLQAFFDDMNNHMWLDFMGRWQSYEKGYYEIEFSPDWTFAEYYYGIRKGSGVYGVNGNTIDLTYSSQSCTQSPADSCHILFEYHFDMNTLILVTNDSRLSFYKETNR